MPEATAVRTFVHVAGPVERERFGRRQRQTIRCLRCDRILAVFTLATLTARWRLGEAVLEREWEEGGMPEFVEGGSYAERTLALGELLCRYKP